MGAQPLSRPLRTASARSYVRGLTWVNKGTCWSWFWFCIPPGQGVAGLDPAVKRRVWATTAADSGAGSSLNAVTCSDIGREASGRAAKAGAKRPRALSLLGMRPLAIALPRTAAAARLGDPGTALTSWPPSLPPCHARARNPGHPPRRCSLEPGWRLPEEWPERRLSYQLRHRPPLRSRVTGRSTDTPCAARRSRISELAGLQKTTAEDQVSSPGRG
jgi:hypothetical protein